MAQKDKSHQSRMLINQITKLQAIKIAILLSLVFVSSFIYLNYTLPQKYTYLQSNDLLHKTLLKHCQNPNTFDNQAIVICGEITSINPTIGSIISIDPKTKISKSQVKQFTGLHEIQKTYRYFYSDPFESEDLNDIMQHKKRIEFLEVLYKCQKKYNCEEIGEGGVGKIFSYPEFNILLKFTKSIKSFNQTVNQIMALDKVNKIWPNFFQHGVYYKDKLIGYSIQYFDGKNIKQALNQQGNILKENPSARVRLVKRLKQIVKKLQQLGVGHGDLNQGNILIKQVDKSKQDYQLMIIDYGLSFGISSLPGLPKLTGWKFLLPPQSKSNTPYKTKGVNPYMLGRISLQILTLSLMRYSEYTDVNTDELLKQNIQKLTQMGFDQTVRKQIQLLLDEDIEFRHQTLMQPSMMKQQVKGNSDSYYKSNLAKKNKNLQSSLEYFTNNCGKLLTSQFDKRNHNQKVLMRRDNKYLAHLEIQMDVINDSSISLPQKQQHQKEISQNITIEVYQLQKFQYINESTGFKKELNLPIQIKNIQLNKNTIKQGLGYIYLDSQKIYFFRTIFSQYHQLENTFNPKLNIKIASQQWIQNILNLRYTLFFIILAFCLILYNQSIMRQEDIRDTTRRQQKINKNIVHIMLFLLVLLLYPFAGIYQNIHHSYKYLFYLFLYSSMINSILFAIFMTPFVLHFRKLYLYTSRINISTTMNLKLKDYFTFSSSDSMLNFALFIGFLLFKIGNNYLIDMEIIHTQMFFNDNQIVVITIGLLVLLIYNFFGTYILYQKRQIVVIVEQEQAQADKQKNHLQLRQRLHENLRIITFPIQFITIAYLCSSIFQIFEQQSNLSSLTYHLAVSLYVIVISYLFKQRQKKEEQPQNKIIQHQVMIENQQNNHIKYNNAEYEHKIK